MLKINSSFNKFTKKNELCMSNEGCLYIPELTAQDVIDYRTQLCMTQTEFAKAFDIPLTTLRNWEQNRSKPVISNARLQFYNKLFDDKAQIIELASSDVMRLAA